jgi:DNA-binding CsgD family transcriptional regulator
VETRVRAPVPGDAAAAPGAGACHHRGVDADVETLIADGRAALAACEWATARSCFEHARATTETAEVLDGLGQAWYWLGDYPRALALRERAFGLYRQRGDHRPAVLVAVQLAALHGMIFGNGAALNGWLGHARQLLEHVGDCPERGWVELFLAVVTGDPVEREHHATAAMELGRSFDEPGLEFDALGYLGKALVERGELDEGMARIDQAVAATTSGLVTDPWAAGEIYCTLFDACEMTVDVRRAEGWLGAVDHYVERTGELPVSGICRMHYGGLLTDAGRWEQAERELSTALAIYDGTYQGTRFLPLIRLADLRIRQGRREEAARLLDGHEQRPEAAIACARLHLARGDLDLAADAVERHLGRRGRGVLSAPTLALLVRIELARGRSDQAARCADELTTLATVAGGPAVRGFAAVSRARVEDVRHEGAAVASYEEAVVAFGDAELRHESAVARLELARLVLEARPEIAHAHARAALAAFEAIGAARDADEAAGLLRLLGERRGRSWSRRPGKLTQRQTQVLALLAEGLTNAEIADRCYISPRTAEHHVSSILSHLGLDNRAEAAAYALRHGIVPTTARWADEGGPSR